MTPSGSPEGAARRGVSFNELRGMSPEEQARALARLVEEARKPATPEAIAELKRKRDNANNECSRAMYGRILERVAGPSHEGRGA